MENKKKKTLNYKIKKPEHFSMQDFIDWIQRYIIVHSYYYYHLNNNYISDAKYDNIARQLTELKNKYPDLWKNSEYYKQFGDDYNGSTGFDLFDKLTERQKKIILSIVHYK